LKKEGLEGASLAAVAAVAEDDANGVTNYNDDDNDDAANDLAAYELLILDSPSV